MGSAKGGNPSDLALSIAILGATWLTFGEFISAAEVRLCSGQGKQEGTAAGDFAFGADRAGVGAHDVFGNGEA